MSIKKVFILFFIYQVAGTLAAPDLSWFCEFSMTPEYTCTLNNVNYTDDTYIMIFAGDHLPGKSDDDVTRVRFTNSRLDRIPPKVLLRFLNLRELTAARSQIKDIRPLISCTRLEILDLSWNSITEVAKDAFDRCTSLQQINLSYNQISELDRDLFVNLENLKSIGLASNRLRSFYHEGLENLEALSLQQNTITRLSAEMFKNMGNLQLIQLTGNGINQISKEIFAPLKKLNTLLLSQNNLPVISGDTFHNNPELSLISLSFNGIRAIGRNFFEGLPNLRYLELQSNVCVSRKFVVPQEGLANVARIMESCFQNYENLI